MNYDVSYYVSLAKCKEAINSLIDTLNSKSKYHLETLSHDEEALLNECNKIIRLLETQILKDGMNARKMYTNQGNYNNTRCAYIPEQILPLLKKREEMEKAKSVSNVSEQTELPEEANIPETVEPTVLPQEENIDNAELPVEESIDNAVVTEEENMNNLSPESVFPEIQGYYDEVETGKEDIIPDNTDDQVVQNEVNPSDITPESVFPEVQAPTEETVPSVTNELDKLLEEAPKLEEAESPDFQEMTQRTFTKHLGSKTKALSVSEAFKNNLKPREEVKLPITTGSEDEFARVEELYAELAKLKNEITTTEDILERQKLTDRINEIDILLDSSTLSPSDKQVAEVTGYERYNSLIKMPEENENLETLGL